MENFVKNFKEKLFNEINNEDVRITLLVENAGQSRDGMISANMTHNFGMMKGYIYSYLDETYLYYLIWIDVNWVKEWRKELYRQNTQDKVGVEDGCEFNHKEEIIIWPKDWDASMMYYYAKWKGLI